MSIDWAAVDIDCDPDAVRIRDAEERANGHADDPWWSDRAVDAFERMFWGD